MAVAVIGAGRSGTNMVLEILTGHPGYAPTEPAEDKQLFTRNAQYLHDYLTKCDTLYCQTIGQMVTLLSMNPKMKLVWTIRDPRDMVLSKLRAGWREGKPMVSDDATFEGCIADMYHMFDLWKRTYQMFTGKRNFTVYFESVLTDTENEIKALCDFLEIPYNDSMPKFYERMRHPGKKGRYGNKLDKGQVGLWKRWTEVYDGLFHPETTKIPVNVGLLFSAMEPIREHFGYANNDS